MQEIIASFSSIMKWLLLLLCLIVVLFGLTTWHLPANRRLALQQCETRKSTAHAQ